MKEENNFRVGKLLIYTLAALAVCVALGFVATASATTIIIPGGSISTTNFVAWSTNTITYNPGFNFATGPTTIQMNGLDMNDILYKGTWGWPPVTGDYGAQARFGISGTGFWSQHSLHSAVGDNQGFWDAQSTPVHHNEGARKYLVQNTWSGLASGVMVGNHQYNKEAFIPRAGPGNADNNVADVTDRDYNKFDMKITYTPTGGGTYDCNGFIRLYKSAAVPEMAAWGPYSWVWNPAINNVGATAAWQPFYDGHWTITGDLTSAHPYVQIINWGVTQIETQKFSWTNMTITGTVAIPCEVWVDDNWAGTIDGTQVEPGKWFGFNAFSSIQAGINAVCAGGTVTVHDGTYSEHVIINKALTLQAGSNPIINGGGGGNGILIQSGNIIIDGFDITNCQNGIRSFGGPATYNNVEIKNCNIYHNQINGIAILSDSMDNFQVRNTTISDTYGNGHNAIGFGNGAVMTHMLLEDITISGVGTSGHGIYAQGVTLTDVLIDTVSISNCGQWQGIMIDNTAVTDFTVVDSTITGSGGFGVLFGPQFGPVVATNILFDNTTISNNGVVGGGSGLTLICTGTNINIQDCKIYGNSWEDLDLGTTWMGASSFTNVLISGCDFTGGGAPWGQILIDNSAIPYSNVQIHCNLFQAGCAIWNVNAATIDGTCNWWATAAGPNAGGGWYGSAPGGGPVIVNPWVGYVVAEANGPYTGNSFGMVQFSGSGYGSGCCDETFVSYDWDFGDSSPHSSAQNPIHYYAASGPYTARLTVTFTGLGHTFSGTDTAPVQICLANLVVDKKVWNGTAWVDNIRVVNGTLLNFKITITSYGTCDLSGITVTDYLSLPQLKYKSGSAKPAPSFSSDNELRWSITTLIPGQTITITYNATAVHYCYGWNAVYIKDYWGLVVGYDLTKVKVVKAGQPTLAINTQVWNDRTNEWSDHIDLTLNKALTFKITVSSTALSTVHNVIVTDILPSLIEYNNDATPSPDSTSSGQITWNLGELSPGDEREITFTVTTVHMGTDYTTASVTSDEGYSDENYVLLEQDSAPTMSLLYPTGGETLKGSISIQWYAHDMKDGNNLPIYVYFKDNDDALWTEFPSNPYTNNGALSWDTTKLPDGSYQIQIATQDSNNNVVNTISTQFKIKNTETPTENLAPNTPGMPSGQGQGKPGFDYTYATSTADPEGDQVYYLWDWGDGTQSEWLGPYTSGDIIETTHTWDAKGTYSIRVKAKDINGHESSWSDPLPITMPYTYTPLQQFLENLFERFPNLFPVLRQLFGY